VPVQVRPSAPFLKILNFSGYRRVDVFPNPCLSLSSYRSGGKKILHNYQTQCWFIIFFEAEMGKSNKLLIIDDNEEVLTSLYEYLSQKKYQVISASNGLDGLKLLDAEKGEFDLIITDLVMPNISGVGVISIVKKKYPTIPVIAITGWGEHPEALATEANADIVLEKPFELSELDKLIAGLLSTPKSKI